MTFVLGYVNWNISPEAFTIGGITVSYYGLCLMAAFLSACEVFRRILKRENFSQILLPITLNAVFLAALAGARLGECLFYFPEYYMKNPMEIFIPFKDGKYTGIGGLSSHGAALAIIPALILTAKNRNLPTLWLIDRVCLAIVPAACLIRIGNLMNSEILGVATSLPWGFVFETRGEDFPRHPVQIYEALCYLCIFLFLYVFYLRAGTKAPQGTVFGLFLVLIFFPRFLLEIFKAPLNEFDMYSTFSTGQYLCLFFALVGTIVLMIKSREM